jgi:hypothetical protein
MRNVIDIHQDLVEQSKEGNRSAQKSLFDLYGTAMFNIGVRILGSKEDPQSGKGKDPFGYRSEFIRLVEKTRLLLGELN